MAWSGLAPCYVGVLEQKICRGLADASGCYKRIARSDLRVDAGWAHKSVLERDFWRGYMTEDAGPHISGHSQINDGIGWSPCAEWTPNRSLLLHLAGWDMPGRNKKMREVALQTAHRFSPRCY